MASKPRTIPRLPYGEGSIYWDPKRGQVVYEYRHNGRVFRERGDTIIEVRQLRTDRIAGVVESARVAGEQTVGVVLAEWLSFDCQGAPMTMHAYRHSVELAAPLHARLITDVTVADVERLFGALTVKLGRASLVKFKSHLAMGFDFGLRRQYVTGNVVRASRLPAGARPAGKATWLGRTEFGAMRAHLCSHPTPANTALLTILLAGVRPGEALGLRWGAVDLHAALVAIQGSLRAESGGRRHVVVDELKTAGSKRTVELPADLVIALRRLHSERRLDVDLVFATTAGTPINPSNLRRACTVACRAIGIDPVTPHKLRHSFASALLDAGMAGPAVSRALGHTDGRMLSKTYGHTMDDVAPTAAALAAFG